MQHLAGQYYHAYNRGANKADIFSTNANYLFLLKKIKQLLPSYPITFIAYVLMPNHYHFLVRLEADHALSPFIQRLFNSYTQSYNHQNTRSGTLFESRVQYKLIDQEPYILQLVRYIHLNPVKADLVKHPQDWPFSNYLEWVGKRSGTLIDHEFVRWAFHSPADYEIYTLQDIPETIDKQLAVYTLD